MKRPEISHFKIDRAWKGEVPFNELSTLEQSRLFEVDHSYRESLRYIPHRQMIPPQASAGFWRLPSHFLKDVSKSSLHFVKTIVAVTSTIATITFGTLYFVDDWATEDLSSWNPIRLIARHSPPNFSVQEWKRATDQEPLGTLRWYQRDGKAAQEVARFENLAPGAQLELNISARAAAALYVGVYAEYDSGGNSLNTKLFPNSSNLLEQIMLTPNWTMPQIILITENKSRETIHVVLADQKVSTDSLMAILNDIKANHKKSDNKYRNFYKKDGATLEIQSVQIGRAYR